MQNRIVIMDEDPAGLNPVQVAVVRFGTGTERAIGRGGLGIWPLIDPVVVNSRQIQDIPQALEIIPPDLGSIKGDMPLQVEQIRPAGLVARESSLKFHKRSWVILYHAPTLQVGGG